MKDKMILKDGTAIELEAGASLGAMQVLSADQDTMVSTWKKLTKENLSEVVIQNGAGLTVGNYADLVLVSEKSVITEEGAVLTDFCLREKTSEEKRLDAMEQEQDVQNGAIADLAGMVAGGEA